MERGKYDSSRFIREVETYTREIISATSEKTIDLKNLGPCPLCTSSVIRGKTGYGCSQWRSGCKFAIKEVSLGLRITPTLMRELLLNKRSLTAHGIQDGSNRVLATLSLDNKGEIGYELVGIELKPTRKDAIGRCPSCGGDILEGPKNYGCSNWREGCKFVIWKTIAQKDIPKEIAQTLLKNGETESLDGFLSRAGKPFSAQLAVTNGEVKFKFEG
tara:strand:- start:106 stop:753 length:648 start_codon:yes stop_codon:yes gene_type:complete